MANIKISELPEATSVQNDDLLTIIQEGTNKKVTKEILLQEVNSDISDIQSEQITQNADIQENETKIQELEQEIQNLKEASYKVTGTGTDITLNNTSNNKFLQLDVKGNTEQTQYSGKNLLPIINQDYTVKGVNFKATNQGKLLINGTANNIIGGSDFIGNNFAKMTLSAGTYVFSRNIANSKVSLGLVKSDGTTSIATLSRANTILSTTFTLNEETDVYLYFYISTNDVVNNYEVEIMVEQGTTATSYEPYVGGTASPNPEYPQPIYNVTGDVNVKIQNKNLLEPLFDSKTQNGITIEFIEEGMKVSGNSTSQYQYFTIFEKELPAGSYVINGIEGSSYSSYILAVYKNNTNIGYVSSSNFTFTLTEPETIKIYFYPYGTDYSTPKIFKYQLEENSTPTSYVPHEEQNLPFTLGTQRLYEGSNLADNGIHNNRKQYTFTGQENWATNPNQNTENTSYFYMVKADMKAGSSIKCNYFVNRATWNTDQNAIQSVVDNSIRVRIDNNVANSLESFKTWLSNNNVIVEYELETEETETYNETQQAQYNAIKEAMSYYGQTNISSTSNEASAKIDATAIGDLNLVIS